MNIKFGGILLAFFSLLFLLAIGFFTKDSNIAFYGTAFATLILAIGTYQMVDEMRNSRIAQSRPYIFVDFDLPYGEQLINIVIKNVGGAAKNIKFEFDPELIDSRGRSISKGPVFLNGISFLPHNKEIKQFFDSATNYFESGKPLKFNLKITYSALKSDKESKKQQFEETFILDLSTFKDLLFVGRKGLHEIAESIDKLAKEVKGLKSAIEIKNP